MNFNSKTARSISLPKGKSELIVFDDETPGFGLRLRDGGSRNWIVQYKIGTKHRRLTLGSITLLELGKAREQARNVLARVRLGTDPAGEKIEARATAADTFGTLVETFLVRQEGRLRRSSFYATELYLRRYAKPLHGLALAKITRKMVAARLAFIAHENGAVSADRARAALSAFFTWAMREGLVEGNPVIATNRASEEKARDRILSDLELRSIWSALEDDHFGTIVRLLILTGQRREEVGALRWSEVDLRRGLISLPGERTKNSKPHDVPLSPCARGILEAQPIRVGRDVVFGEGEGGFQGWSKAKSALNARTKQIAPWRLHDVRRTVATGMAELGVVPHIVEAVLNHVSGAKAGVAGIYNRAVYASEKRAALELWAGHLLTVVGDRPRLAVVA